MNTRCSRCGLKIQGCVDFCPACGNELLQAPQRIDAKEDYYEILNLSPHAPAAQIRTALAEATRVWSSRANNAPQMEDRHKAERLLRLLEEAESILLNPTSRSAYDEALRSRRSKKDAAPVPRPFPTHADSRPRNQVPHREAHEPTTPTGNETVEESPSGFLHFFGWRKLAGTVLGVDPPYLSKPDTSLAGVVGKLVLALLLIPVFLGIMVAVVVMRAIFYGCQRSSGQPSFSSGLASQVFGFFLTGKLFSPKEQVIVRDFRLRDSRGYEHLVRIRGELVAGNLSVGDEVEVEGFNRRGTLMFRKGQNKRTRSEITVKYR